MPFNFWNRQPNFTQYGPQGQQSRAPMPTAQPPGGVNASTQPAPIQVPAAAPSMANTRPASPGISAQPAQPAPTNLQPAWGQPGFAQPSAAQPGQPGQSQPAQHPPNMMAPFASAQPPQNGAIINGLANPAYQTAIASSANNQASIPPYVAQPTGQQSDGSLLASLVGQEPLAAGVPNYAGPQMPARQPVARQPIQPQRRLGWGQRAF